MTERQSNELDKFEFDVRVRMRRVIDAISFGALISLSFHHDGSGVGFYYVDTTCNHGMPGSVVSYFPIDQAMIILMGVNLPIKRL